MTKKKVLSAILTTLMLLSAATPCVFAQTPSEGFYVTIGNIVDDGNVNIKDSTAVQKHLAGIITLSDIELLSADTNGDGIVNIKDATVIQKHIAGISTVSEIGVVITLPQEIPSTPDETEPETATVPTCTGCDIPISTEAPLPTNPGNTVQTDPIEIPSTPDTAQKDIYYNVEHSERVTYYEGRDTSGTILHLIKSPEELKEVISGIKVTMYGDGTYTTPQVSSEYTEEFFEEYALVVSLNCVGGSNCWQKIDRLFVESAVLTTQRTLFHPCIVLCDMNWQYVLIKVKAEDVQNVECLADDTYVDECAHVDPTEPTVIIDPTEPTTPPSVDPTPAPTTEPATTQKPTEATTPIEKGNIPFSIKEEGRITDYIGSDQTLLFYADSREKAKEAFSQIILDPYYQGNYFLNPALDDKYNEEYFKDKSLIISLNCVGGSNCHQSIDKLTLSDGVLTLYRSLYKPFIVTCDMNYQYMLIEIDKKDVDNITSIQNHNTYFTIEDE